MKLMTLATIGRWPTLMGLTGLMCFAANPTHTMKPKQKVGMAEFDNEGKLLLPKGFHQWQYIGSPVTPNALNNGEAGFPEFHDVYMAPWAFDEYKKTGKFPEGTVIVKELVKTIPGEHPDGSIETPAGRGYYEGAYNGADVVVKDTEKYKATNGWGFFNFGHHAKPYETTATPRKKEECASCHNAGASKTDYVWVKYYPIMLDKDGQ